MNIYQDSGHRIRQLQDNENTETGVDTAFTSVSSVGLEPMIPAFTYLLTPWSRVLLEKLASLQLVKKFPTFYGTRRFLTALTRARHLSLS